MQDGQVQIDAVLKEMREISGLKDQEIAILRATIVELRSALQTMIDATETANS